MILENVITRIQVMSVASEARQRDDACALTQCRVVRVAEEAARKPAFKAKPLALVAGDQAHGDAVAALQISHNTAIDAAKRLKVSIQRADLDAQSAGPPGNELHAECAAQQLMPPVAQSEEVVITDKLRSIHRGGGEVE